MKRVNAACRMSSPVLPETLTPLGCCGLYVSSIEQGHASFKVSPDIGEVVGDIRHDCVS